MRAMIAWMTSLGFAGSLMGQNGGTRMLAQPAVSSSHVAFIYAGDVWTAKLDGSDVRRITTADGDESNPVFSDDGQWLAFAGNYDGNRFFSRWSLVCGPTHIFFFLC